MKKPLISLIAAFSENRVIGNKGEIPWHIPGEQKRFKEITTPHPVIMGRKTYESIGRLLPNRPNIIITSDRNVSVGGGYIVHSLDEAIEKAKELENKRLLAERYSGAKRSETIEPEKDPLVSTEQRFQEDTGAEIFIIGGGRVFDEAIKMANKLYLTIIHKTIEGDAFFPEYSEFKKVVFKEEKEIGEYQFTYLDLVRE